MLVWEVKETQTQTPPGREESKPRSPALWVDALRTDLLGLRHRRPFTFSLQHGRMYVARGLPGPCVAYLHMLYVHLHVPTAEVIESQTVPKCPRHKTPIPWLGGCYFDAQRGRESQPQCLGVCLCAQVQAWTYLCVQYVCLCVCSVWASCMCALIVYLVCAWAEPTYVHFVLSVHVHRLNLCARLLGAKSPSRQPRARQVRYAHALSLDACVCSYARVSASSVCAECVHVCASAYSVCVCMCMYLSVHAYLQVGLCYQPHACAHAGEQATSLAAWLRLGLGGRWMFT